MVGGGGGYCCCCCCCRNLKQYLQMGLKLTKVHKVLSFDQSPWLDPYIEKNTETRRLATNPVDVARAKAMVRSEQQQQQSVAHTSSSSSRITVYLVKVSRTQGTIEIIILSTIQKSLPVCRNSQISKISSYMTKSGA